jgi:hypothetical protein
MCTAFTMLGPEGWRQQGKSVFWKQKAGCDRLSCVSNLSHLQADLIMKPSLLKILGRLVNHSNF